MIARKLYGLLVSDSLRLSRRCGFLSKDTRRPPTAAFKQSQMLRIADNLRQYRDARSAEEKHALLSYCHVLFVQLKKKLIEKRLVPLHHSKHILHYIPSEVLRRFATDGKMTGAQQFTFLKPVLDDLSSSIAGLRDEAAKEEPDLPAARQAGEHVYRALSFLVRFEDIVGRSDFQDCLHNLVHTVGEVAANIRLRQDDAILQRFINPSLMNLNLAVCILLKASPRNTPLFGSSHVTLAEVFEHLVASLASSQENLVSLKCWIGLASIRRALWPSNNADIIAGKSEQEPDRLAILLNQTVADRIERILQTKDLGKKDLLDSTEAISAKSALGSSIQASRSSLVIKIITEAGARSSILHELSPDERCKLLAAVISYFLNNPEKSLCHRLATVKLALKTLVDLLSDQEGKEDLDISALTSLVSSLADLEGMSDDLWLKYQAQVLTIINSNRRDNPKVLAIKLLDVLILILKSGCWINGRLFETSIRLLRDNLPYNRESLYLLCAALNYHPKVKAEENLKKETAAFFQTLKVLLFKDEELFITMAKIYLEFVRWSKQRIVPFEQKLLSSLRGINRLWLCGQLVILNTAIPCPQETFSDDVLLAWRQELDHVLERAFKSKESALNAMEMLAKINQEILFCKSAKREDLTLVFDQYCQTAEKFTSLLTDKDNPKALHLIRSEDGSIAFNRLLKSLFFLLSSFNKPLSKGIISKTIDLISTGNGPKSAQEATKLIKTLLAISEFTPMSQIQQERLEKILANEIPVTMNNLKSFMLILKRHPTIENLKTKLKTFILEGRAAFTNLPDRALLTVVYHGLFVFLKDEEVLAELVDLMDSRGDSLGKTFTRKTSKHTQTEDADNLTMIRVILTAFKLPELKFCREKAARIEVNLRANLQVIDKSEGEGADLPYALHKSLLQRKVGVLLSELGFKFREEVEISGFMVDFLLEDNLIVEVLGDFHFDTEGIIEAKALTRKKIIEQAGYKVIFLMQNEMGGSYKQRKDFILKRLKEGNPPDSELKIVRSLTPISVTLDLLSRDDGLLENDQDDEH